MSTMAMKRRRGAARNQKLSARLAKDDGEFGGKKNKPGHTLSSPVVYERDFLGKTKCDEICDAHHGKNNGKKGERGRLCLEAPRVRLPCLL